MLPKLVKIKKIIQENQKVKTFVLEEKVKATPGQYLMIGYQEWAKNPLALLILTH